MSQEAISMLFGLKDGILYSRKEVAEHLDTTVKKVRQIKEKTLRKLKKNKKLSTLM